MRAPLALLLLPPLAACVASGESRVDFAAADTSGHVSAVTLVAARAGAAPGFREAFAAKALARLETCGHGPRALTVQADIVAFHAASGVKTYFLGDANEVRGLARLVDEEGRPVAAYAIHRRYSGQDLYGAVAMRDPVGQMAEAFADELCRRAFAPPGR